MQALFAAAAAAGGVGMGCFTSSYERRYAVEQAYTPNSTTKAIPPGRTPSD